MSEKQKKQSASINPKTHGKCFKYAFIASLHHEDIKNNPQRNTSLKRFADQYNWEKITFLQNKKIGKKNEESNQNICIKYSFC